MKLGIFLLGLLVSISLCAQQVSDTSFNPEIVNPAYLINEGPVIQIDASHHNFHTAEGLYAPFANLLKRDGYQFNSLQGLFTKNALHQGKILVISNALNAKDVEHWHEPNYSGIHKRGD